MGAHFYHQVVPRRFVFDSTNNVAVELRPLVYAHDYNYNDHAFYYGIPYFLSYSGEIAPLPWSLRLRFYTSENYLGDDVFVEKTSIRYMAEPDGREIECKRPISNGSISKETFNAGYSGAHTRVTYEAEVNVLDCINKREDFELKTTGYLLHKGKKIPFEFINSAHYLTSDLIWTPGWLLLYVDLIGE